MRKGAVLLVLAILISLPFSAQAATTRATTARPVLTFSGSRANCSAYIFGNSSSDYIEATIKLWHETTCVKTWKVTGQHYISFSETANATQGNTYVLIVHWSLNGVRQTSESVIKTYE